MRAKKKKKSLVAWKPISAELAFAFITSTVSTIFDSRIPFLVLQPRTRKRRHDPPLAIPESTPMRPEGLESTGRETGDAKAKADDACYSGSLQSRHSTSYTSECPSEAEVELHVGAVINQVKHRGGFPGTRRTCMNRRVGSRWLTLRTMRHRGSAMPSPPVRRKKHKYR